MNGYLVPITPDPGDPSKILWVSVDGAEVFNGDEAKAKVQDAFDTALREHQNWNTTDPVKSVGSP